MEKWLLQGDIKEFKMNKILIFAGTSEGRMLVESIGSGIKVHCCVATEYGKELLPKERDGLKILQGRLTLEDMVELINREKYSMIIDTTHPYAKIVTENIKKAAQETGVEYIRFLRKSQEYHGSIKMVDTVEEAVDYLNQSEKIVLLTVGSKELPKFTKVRDYENRVYARVLPMVDVVKQCVDLNFKGNKLICMQGPFTEAMNEALIEQTKAEIMVTKDTGKAGGFLEKVQAAIKKNLEVVVIKRPLDERGYSLDEIKNLIVEKFGEEAILRQSYIKCAKEVSENFVEAESAENIGNFKSISENNYENRFETLEIKESDSEKKSWFPIFINIEKEKILFVGGGKIAKRRLETLSNFKCNIKIVAPEIDTDIKNMSEENSWVTVEREFLEKDLKEATMVFAITDNKALNEKIGELARDKKIKINVASTKEHCSFYFPGIAMWKDTTVGVISQGKDHREAKEITNKIKTLFK